MNTNNTETAWKNAVINPNKEVNMTKATTYEYTDTVGLLALARNAEENNFNRQIETDLVREKIDPDGIHILVLNFVHNEDHMRTNWLAKFRDSDDPVNLTIDVTFEAFNEYVKEGEE